MASSLFIYLKGLDLLKEQWERTRRFLADTSNVDAVQEYYFWRKNMSVWICCAIESFVNEQGVSLLGEDFYKGNLERLDITKKIAVLYALKYRKRLSKNDVVLKQTKQLFDLRNQWVHPKGRFVSKKDNSNTDPFVELRQITPEKFRKQFWDVANLFLVIPRTKKRKDARQNRPRKRAHSLSQ